MTHAALALLLAQDARPPGYEYAASARCNNQHVCTLVLAPPLPVNVSLLAGGQVHTLPAARTQGAYVLPADQLRGGTVKYWIDEDAYQRQREQLDRERAVLEPKADIERKQQQFLESWDSEAAGEKRRRARATVLLTSLEIGTLTHGVQPVSASEVLLGLLASIDQISPDGTLQRCPAAAEACHAADLSLYPGVDALQAALAAEWSSDAREAFNTAPERWAAQRAEGLEEVALTARDHALAIDQLDSEVERIERWHAATEGQVFEFDAVDGPLAGLGFTPRVQVSAAVSFVDSSHSADLGATWFGIPWSRTADLRVALTPERAILPSLNAPESWRFQRLYLHAARDLSVISTTGEQDYRSLSYAEWRLGLSYRWTQREIRSWHLSAGVRTQETSTVHESATPLWRGEQQAQAVYQVAPKGPLGPLGVHGYYLEFRRSLPLYSGKESILDMTPPPSHPELHWALRLSDEPTRTPTSDYALTRGDATELAALPKPGGVRLTFSMGASFGGL